MLGGLTIFSFVPNNAFEVNTSARFTGAQTLGFCANCHTAHFRTGILTHGGWVHRWRGRLNLIMEDTNHVKLAQHNQDFYRNKVGAYFSTLLQITHVHLFLLRFQECNRSQTTLHHISARIQNQKQQLYNNNTSPYMYLCLSHGKKAKKAPCSILALINKGYVKSIRSNKA